MPQKKSRKRRVKTWAIATVMSAAILALALTGAKASNNSPVKAELTAWKILTTPSGQEKRDSARTAKPGDILEYRVAYQNQGDTAVKGLLATLPVPEGMSYLPQAANPAITSASLDGKQFESIPLMRWVRQADGTLVQQQVPFEDYRFLRWQLGVLDAGTETTVSARVQINR